MLHKYCSKLLQKEIRSNLYYATLPQPYQIQPYLTQPNLTHPNLLLSRFLRICLHFASSEYDIYQFFHIRITVVPII